MWRPETVTPPANEPLDLTTEVAQALRLSADEVSAQAQYLALKIAAARQECEAVTRRRLITQTVDLHLDCWREPGIFFNGYLALPYPPCDEVVTVKYDDPSDPDTEITMDSDDYVVSGPGPETAFGSRARLSMAPGLSWPSVYPQPGAIRIRLTVGYGATFASVPQKLKDGMLLVLAEGYARREEATSGTIVSPNLRSAYSSWFQFIDRTEI